MNAFLYELARTIHSKYQELDKLTVVFPNRRAVLYFKKHLSDIIDKPVFPPSMITIEDFIGGFSSYKVPDKLELIHRLYLSYNSTINKTGVPNEAFDKFYFWGDMLLRDFDELDKYLVKPELIFKDLTVQKEMDASFEFLTDEQKEFLRDFWKSFEENVTENKLKFLAVWNRLHQLYIEFRKQLSSEGLAYEGMLHRDAAESLDKSTTSKFNDRPIVFAGFNALTKAEEQIMSFFVEHHQADVYWDIDEYYVHNNTQEAGRYFRQYRRHDVLGKTFDKNTPANFMGQNVSETGKTKLVKIYGAAEPVSQAKVMSQILHEQLDKGLNPEETLIVLPDEKLLIPVLHGLSRKIEKLNVTMGFPLASTPVFSMAELLVDLQIARRKDHFNHRQALALLGHPYIVAADPISASSKRKEILNHNWVQIPKGFLATTQELHRLIFKEATATSIIDYLQDILLAVGKLDVSDLDKEYIFNFLKLLNRMKEITGEGYAQLKMATVREEHTALRAFLRLMRQLIQAHKIPFTGEPLRGLQIMGVLETRNLDYKNVFILSLNEGAFPGLSAKGSYIPFNIRRAYGMPTVEHQDAIYAYLFYRVLQRAENIHLFYNSETDVLGQGEASRYLQQLIYESGLEIDKKVLHNPIQPRPVIPITIPKTNEVKDALLKLNEGNNYFKGISPSALNTYIECRLRFYLHYIARIREPKEVEEDLDARIFGELLHGIMELFYTGIRERKQGKKSIDLDDLANADEEIDALIDKGFIKTYNLNPDEKVIYDGQRLVVREIVKRFAHKIIEHDRAYAPFILEATEQGGLLYSMKLPDSDHTVLISGKIDRVDRKDDVVRVIDYKTGKDQLDFESIASLFVRDGKRNKAAFQTLLYALLYKSYTRNDQHRIVPGLINRMNLFDQNFQFGFKMNREYIEDIEPMLPEFKQHLSALVEELFVSDTAFDQTTNVDLCRFCAFQGICYR